MTSNNYIPNQQDIIWIDFDPSRGSEINKRRPAVVISNQGYSKITNLAVVAPITHATSNRFSKTPFMVPVVTNEIDGYVNALQFYTLDFKSRHADKIGQLDSNAFALVKQVMLDIIE
jgi:mRNA interferase MazF